MGRHYGALLALLGLITTLHSGAGFDPHVSQISPNSVYDPQHDIGSSPLETSDVIDLEPSIQLSNSALSEADESLLKHLEDEVADTDHPHVIVVRSAAPILQEFGRRSRPYDSLHHSKNIEETLETNDVEVHHKPQYYNQIHPTRTMHESISGGKMVSSILGTGGEVRLNQGEAKGVPRSRALTPEGPQNHQSATPKDSATSPRSASRQANPDIQDIITGIVKLLNGNVNVQANTQPANGRPGRPPNTRINNRGPPRISDVPPLPPDFDTPGPAGPGQLVPPMPPQTSTKIPPPYPFDRPPNIDKPPHRPFLNGVPLPEQIVPILNNQNYRPSGFVGGRPQNIPPWQRPRPRPQNPNRRPNPNLPMYKPLPSSPPEPPPQYTELEENFTSETPIDEPILKPKPHDVYTNYENKPDNESNAQENETIQGEKTHDNNENSNHGEDNINNITQKVPEMAISDEETISFVKDRDPPTTSTESPDTTIDEAKEEFEIKITTTEEPKKNEEEPSKQEILKDGDISDKKKQSIAKVEKEKPNNNKKQEDKNKDSEQSLKNPIKLGEEDAIKDFNNSIIFQSTPVLESSQMESSSSSSVGGLNDTKIVLSTSSTPTEGLPSIAATIDSSINSGSISSISPTAINSLATSSNHPSFPYKPYRPRPGIVLDDPEYRPGGGRPHGNGSVVGVPSGGHRYRPPPGNKGEIFDVTVSAIQGPGGGKGSATVHIENVNPLTGQPGDIIVSASGDQGFVSIDGKRTYLNLMGGQATPSHQYRPTAVVKPTAAISGTGYAVPEVESGNGAQSVGGGASIPHRGAPHPPRRPQNQPPVRIDTCIVGDDSTCDQTQNEKCKTEAGISSCQCRPGYARRNHRDPCRKVVAMVFSLRVDRMYDRKVSWDEKLNDKESEAYRQLSYEAVRAVDSAFSMTPYSDEFVSGSVNTIYKGSKTEQGVFVNVTVLLEESSETVGGQDITRHLLGVIQRRSNNVGQSALWVDHTRGSISPIQDLDECSSPELNDCHDIATCTNVWGSFKCECPEESRDAWSDQPLRAGRNCHTCQATHCSNRGTCSYRGGQPVCACTGAYYGSQCEVDGEVVGVAVGASLAALLVILITLACLIMWSRRWSREQKSAGGLGSPVFGYMAGGVKVPNIGHPPYQVSLEERMRWAQLADVMAQANHYAPEPGQGHPGARPSSAMYGAYPTLPNGTLPPVPRPRLGLHMGGSTLQLNSQGVSGTSVTSRANTLSGMGLHGMGMGMGNTFSALSGTWLSSQQQLQQAESSSSSESDSRAPDRADLLGARGFHVPRPKSRSNTTNSIANQSGIYYDVDYENAPDPIYGTKGIPLSTYTVNRNMPYYGQ